MGYPMTYRRFVNRNRLDPGDYQRPPEGWPWAQGKIAHVDLEGPTCGYRDAEALATGYRNQIRQMHEERNATAGRIGALAGDLRRLERDAVDEGAICELIAQKTGIYSDVVAAVLKEFFAT